MAFAPVFAVWDYFDAPRSGIALVEEQPCYFRCDWDEERDDYASSYRVYAIDQETLILALEQHGIFRLWERAFHAGEVSLATHPANEGAHQRFAELDSILRARLKTARLVGRYTVEFVVRTGQEGSRPGVMRELDASWQPVV
jgi:hypothetical protein